MKIILLLTLIIFASCSSMKESSKTAYDGDEFAYFHSKDGRIVKYKVDGYRGNDLVLHQVKSKQVVIIKNYKKLYSKKK